ncbi:hypothetical protein BT69DRAFT_1276371 [Atractiella rhizophila]|nr:hypothetical protein BT69DRAFT_1276371 [Atractiella rhizophila]
MTPEDLGLLRQFRMEDGALWMDLPLEAARIAEGIAGEQGRDETRVGGDGVKHVGEVSKVTNNGIGNAEAESRSAVSSVELDGRAGRKERGDCVETALKKHWVKVTQIPYRECKAFGRHPRYYS